MSVIAEFSIEADQFLLGRIIAEFPNLAVEIERVVPTGNRIMPYIWGYGEDLDEFVSAMQDHRNVKSIIAVDQVDNQALYKIEWEDPTEQLIAGIAETTATILKARSNDVWTFEIRFEDHKGLAEFNEYCTAHGIEYSLERVSALTDSQYFEKSYALTKPQYEALSLAVEYGYFEIPREVTYKELAEQLDISEQAVSERVRRATNKVLRAIMRGQSSFDF
ncbi:helix-turn-helix domain-containing protein [Halobaculum magnesiiphilum]|uniref:Helix-turn-helix domain-containing protein n=1 Tax=Halobaculum magnesiiphilum TaxID=1017351 RepID=A0A8T8WIK8_9EURY|nr:helix-turn-helix domain-containing protein [Halobaculum magnesiiphilum]QZP39564.1 helix-turn-helix domain-containing protein [Halobaculum magnesiiphilum]